MQSIYSPCLPHGVHGVFQQHSISSDVRRAQSQALCPPEPACARNMGLCPSFGLEMAHQA